MTNDVRLLHRTAVQAASAEVSAVSTDDLVHRTPCSDWNLGGLLAHMIGQHRGFASAVRDKDAPASSYAPVPYTAAAWDDSVVDLLDAFAAADPDGSSRQIEFTPEPLPNHLLFAAHLLDTVVHTWDVARALGTAFTPSDEMTDAVLTIARQIPETAKGNGKPFVAAVPGGGSDWEQALRLLGRDPSWA